MKKDLKYILILAATIALYVVIELITPKPIDWTVTFSYRDKNPFGGYLVNERLPDLFPGYEVVNNNLTIYELQDSAVDNLLVISEVFAPTEEDMSALLEKIDQGMHAFIAAQYYGQIFIDTLGVEATDYFFNDDLVQNLNLEDTAALSFMNNALTDTPFAYKRENASNYFMGIDTLNATVIAVNDLDEPVLVRIPMGQGQLILCSTPLAFTNNYLLYEKNNEFVSTALSYLPLKDVYRTEYYQLGRMEATTPLRFILSDEALKWAYFISIMSLLLFIVFEAKRKQRIIPIITPLANTTLEFIGTISNLYFQKKDHRSIADKRINFFLDRVRSHYFLNINTDDGDIIEKLAHKSGNDEEEVKKIFDQIHVIRNKANITEEELLALSKRIDDFKIV